MKSKTGYFSAKNLSWTWATCQYLKIKLEALFEEVGSFPCSDVASIRHIYERHSQLHNELSSLLGPNCLLMIESNDFFRALLSRLFGNRALT